MTAKIKVDGLSLSLKKGMYESEQHLENHFTVSAEVAYRPEQIEKGAYLNYETLARICSEEMRRDIQLLESIAENILERIAAEWPFYSAASVRICKHNPAFSGYDLGAVLVEMDMRSDIN